MQVIEEVEVEAPAFTLEATGPTSWCRLRVTWPELMAAPTGHRWEQSAPGGQLSDGGWHSATLVYNDGQLAALVFEGDRMEPVLRAFLSPSRGDMEGQP